MTSGLNESIFAIWNLGPGETAPQANKVEPLINHADMEPFLKQVAEHYYDDSGMSELCFIFPNRRSMAFFRKWLAEAVKNNPEARPLVAPEMLTMNDFFYRTSGASVTDRVTLLLELYECYRELNRKAETLDDFIFWGDVILADFDDTDKYLADPSGLFANVADFRAIQDTYSYLTDTQCQAIEKFISHFRSGGKLTVNLDSDRKNVKEKFLLIWNLLYPLYMNFRKALTLKGMGYEGMVYRSFADRLKKESVSDVLAAAMPGKSKFVFVGLNALNECEKTVMRKMRDAGIAEFCWDFSSSMLKDRMNCASRFMSSNVSDFPQAFVPDESAPLAQGPDIHIISISSSFGQVKQLPDILKCIAENKTGGHVGDVGRLDVPGADTAVVLPDENLLIPVLNTIPEEISSVNVTMGYPMSGSEIYSFMGNVSALQLHLRKTGTGWMFYHRQVWAILNSGVFTALADEDTKARAAKVKADARFYIPQEDLSGTWLLDLIFRPVVRNAASADVSEIHGLESYQLEVLSKIGARLAEKPGMALEVNFAKQYYLAVNRLKSLELNVLPMTYMRLFQQLIGGVSVPFKGEPLKGLQIMGPLETRALDFTNLVVLSCNEGVFPRRSVSSSFIPPELRQGFGLPTYENQDAVWAYYFFRMVQRAENVWLLYDSRTEGLKSGEESRYIKQLEYQFGYEHMDRRVVRYSVGAESEGESIRKTPEDMECIKLMTYSVSALQKYLYCPAQFYYAYVKRLRKDDDVNESLDSGMLGDIYHAVMQAAYLGGKAMDPDFAMDRENVENAVKSGTLVPLKEITADYMRMLLSKEGKNAVRNKIRALIRTQLKAEEVSGRNLIMESLLNDYVVKTLETDMDLMRRKGVDRFSVIGLEKRKRWVFDGYEFCGYVDRIDSFGDGSVRVVDYKTGKVKDEEMNEIPDSKTEAAVDELFSPETKYENRKKILFQLFIYDKFMEDDFRGTRVSNVIYPVQKLFSTGIKEVVKNERFNALAEERLSRLFAELGSPEVDFRRTEDRTTCQYCDFRKICGR